MVSVKVTVTDPVGLHARPASQFVKEATSHTARITVQAGDRVADAKSILKVLSLGVKCGQSITITADGPDEDAAIARLTELMTRTGGA